MQEASSAAAIDHDSCTPPLSKAQQEIRPITLAGQTGVRRGSALLPPPTGERRTTLATRCAAPSGARAGTLRETPSAGANPTAQPSEANDLNGTCTQEADIPTSLAHRAIDIDCAVHMASATSSRRRNGPNAVHASTASTCRSKRQIYI